MVGGVNCFNNFINLKKSRISRTFWGYRSRMTRWLRSGDGGNAGCACGLDSTMGNGYYGYRNYAVRPALYSTVIN